MTRHAIQPTRPRKGAAELRRATLALLCAALLLSLLVPTITAHAEAPANDAFARTWGRSDRPVADGRAARTWMWGPEAFTAEMPELYAEAPNGVRKVQYFDKSRMEITNPNADSSADWYVTNGLLVVELVTGEIQTGDDRFEALAPASLNVAGDDDDPTGPTYRTFLNLLDAPARDEGALIVERLDRSGKVIEDAGLAARGVSGATYVPETGHTVAAPFWEFMNSTGLIYRDGQFLSDKLFANPFYATGLPITEAYWAEVKVGGVYKDVLLQCFERRCLTFTPDNPEGWRVEAGNVGRHYYRWRYADSVEPLPLPDPTPEPTPEPTPDPTPEPTPDPQPEPDPEPTPEPLPEPVTDYLYTATIGGPTDERNAFDKLSGIAMSPDGTLVTVDQSTERVQRFNSAGGWLMGFGDGPQAGPTEAPMDVEIDASGNIWVLDWGKSRIMRFSDSGNTLEALGTSINPPLKNPAGFTIGPNGKFYVSDSGNHRVVVLNRDGSLSDYWGSKGTEPGQFTYPTGIAVDDFGYVYVADQNAHRIQKFHPTGSFVGRWGSEGSGQDEFKYPSELEIGKVGERTYLYIADFGNHRVQVYSTDATYVRTIGAAGTQPGQMKAPIDIAVDGAGYVYVAGRDDGYVHKFANSGAFVTRWSSDSRSNFDAPLALDVDEDGLIYVTDPGLTAVKAFGLDGALAAYWDQHLTYPRDVAVHDGVVYVCDVDGLELFSPDGNYIETWAQFGPDGVGTPDVTAVDVDAAGNVYVADRSTQQVHKLSPAGEYLTSWGEPGSDAGEFELIGSIAVSGDEVFVSDLQSNRIQAFSLAGEFLREFTGPGSDAQRFSWLDADTDGYIYALDHVSGALFKFSRSGDLVTTLSAETVGWPPAERVVSVAVLGQDAIFMAANTPHGILMLAAESGPFAPR